MNECILHRLGDKNVIYTCMKPYLMIEEDEEEGGRRRERERPKL